MSATVAIATTAVFLAGLARRARTPRRISLERFVIATTAALCILGIAAVMLGALGWFGPVSVSAVGLALAIAFAVWPPPPRAAKPAGTALRRGEVVGLVMVAVASVGLGLPAATDALAGRDQGTYALRARDLVESGSFETIDPVVAEASTTLGDRPGPADVVGLFPLRGESWLRGRYDASYRPGWYLADREAGRVVPQFLHLLPTWLAIANLLGGPVGAIWFVLGAGALASLTLFAVACRLWPTGPWRWLATALYVGSPLLIWTHRTALTEPFAGLLLLVGLLGALRGHDDARALVITGLVLGAIAWLRGNAWLWAPLVLALTWWVPPNGERRRAPAVVLASLVVASVGVHAFTGFPYLYDEFHRQLGFAGHMSPTGLAWAAIIMALAWLSIDELAFHRRTPAWVGSAQRHAWLGLAVVLAAGLCAWLVLRAVLPDRPYARLDALPALLGPIILGVAAIGIATTLRRLPAPREAAHVWCFAIAAIGVATIGLYAQRNVPGLGLYYYGRYLAPEIIPLAILAGVAGVASVHQRVLARGHPRLAHALAGSFAVALVLENSAVLVLQPQTRLPEYEGAERIVDAIAERVPPHAIVIAGGEGWHHGHTFNQVGGSLAFGHGIEVLPYRTRESAYATAYELLVARPRARGEPAPPVFLLLGEATHALQLEGTTVVAAFDDRLPAPLRATEVALLELYSDRLTPVIDAVPTRITRDELRMALLRVVADEPGEHRLKLADPNSGLGFDRGRLRADALCLGKRPVTIELPAAIEGPQSLVLVAAAGTAEHTHRFTIEIDGERRSLGLASAPAWRGDTLGPIVLEHAPRRLRVSGTKTRVRKAVCPRGGLVEIRLLPPDGDATARASFEALVIPPARDLGHPVVPRGWVSGRGLSRLRAGVEGFDRVVGQSMRLVADADGRAVLRFRGEAVPDGATTPLDVVVNVTAAELDPSARLRLIAGSRVIAEIDPPDERTRSWQSDAARMDPSGAIVAFSVELVGAREGQFVDIRDIGLFSREPPRFGEIRRPTPSAR